MDPALLDQVNKRLTLNLLIQGSAQHAMLTSHHLVRDELNQLDTRLLRLYDQFAAFGFMQYWRTSSSLLLGRPRKFWRRTKRRRHPFHRHRLLATYGGRLAEASRLRAKERCREKGVWLFPCMFSFHAAAIMFRTTTREQPFQQELVLLARHATHVVWGIGMDRLEGHLTQRVAFGKLSKPRSITAFILRACAAGYGGVVRDGDGLKVCAKATAWPILSHELVKGAAELICLHGLSTLDKPTCEKVLAITDRIEYEPWMLQTGAELWRLLLPLLPDDRSQAEMLMHMARLPPRSLESLLIAVLEQPEWARELLGALGR